MNVNDFVLRKAYNQIFDSIAKYELKDSSYHDIGDDRLAFLSKYSNVVNIYFYTGDIMIVLYPPTRNIVVTKHVYHSSKAYFDDNLNVFTHTKQIHMAFEALIKFFNITI
jgi:hypothetical protein